MICILQSLDNSQLTKEIQTWIQHQ